MGFYDGFKIYDENKRMIFWDQGEVELDSTATDANKSEDLRPKSDLRELIYSFVMTDGDSNRRYCSSLLFYVSIEIGDID